MPTYEYKCDACGARFEKFQSIKSGPIRKCPKCGKSKVRRLISTGAGLIFKGSGFYITDYRSEAYKASAKSESGEKPDSSRTESGKPEAGKSESGKSEPARTESPKPAAKTEPGNSTSAPPPPPKPSKKK
ncbi:MAG TPA: zinc ribbon domain-containing protein [Tepidisphaeraceae bacterium]|jgi:putative FmdB family regulatory protein|nr:zinc ribbon domain-containing protein [Tepidisphaeraceae bacterium]